ncbi:hypothetical protein BV22DRAFT_1200069 [Leucogyrophana mollusca]|uniref:Uncharacterized protein n=1 Tax=Leucogyrophana mollusca TaxID=85980 RepID=A0ACB8AZ01_9AGAM|nr:hypothetical protein BV22DRAFT_1200069 [Leucogyrophana mollusca]
MKFLSVVALAAVAGTAFGAAIPIEDRHWCGPECFIEEPSAVHAKPAVEVRHVDVEARHWCGPECFIEPEEGVHVDAVH